MRNTLRGIGLLIPVAMFALLAIEATPAFSQYRVVASCPGVTDIQPAGTSGAIVVVDTKGNACGGGGTTSTVNQGTPASINTGWPTIGGELSTDATGTFTNATQTTSVMQVGVDGYGTAMVSINGTYGTGTGVFELSDDGGTTWYPVQGSRIDSCTVEPGYTGLTNTNRVWTIPISGADQVRVRSTAVASGTINIRISVSSAVPPSSTAVCGTVTLSSQYPVGSVALTGNGAGSTGAVVGTLTATATTTAYICGFAISATGGVATLGPITVAGLIGSSMVFQLFSTATGANLSQQFNPCIPASAVSTNITITTTADGTASAVDVNSWGYRF